MNENPKVALIMGSDSDYEVLKPAISFLKENDIEVVCNVMSAHRTPDLAKDFAKNAEADGIEVIIAAAGMAAHLPGVLAAFTTLPVIGIPVKGKVLDGVDALHSIVQMPSGIPVATVGIDNSKNAAILAVQILSLKYPYLKGRLKKFKEDMRNEVIKKNERLQEKIMADC
ncbi:MAG: 5-(carboxyamino)imidazole ribonucleotide mutase [Ruminococcaceae bacterium]|nr:5-(carboxyamino)imidazole ribonucleotide mutase [Oscillospiraceae bacterium]